MLTSAILTDRMEALVGAMFSPESLETGDAALHLSVDVYSYGSSSQAGQHDVPDVADGAHRLHHSRFSDASLTSSTSGTARVDLVSEQEVVKKPMMISTTTTAATATTAVLSTSHVSPSTSSATDSHFVAEVEAAAAAAAGSGEVGGVGSTSRQHTVSAASGATPRSPATPVPREEEPLRLETSVRVTSARTPKQGEAEEPVAHEANNAACGGGGGGGLHTMGSSFFSCSTLAKEDTRHVSGVDTVFDVVAAYRAAAVRVGDPLFSHVIGILNPGSGDHDVAEQVLRGMREELGPGRVLVLSADVFRNPSVLRKMIKEQAVRYHDVVSLDGDGEAAAAAAMKTPARSPTTTATTKVSGPRSEVASVASTATKNTHKSSTNGGRLFGRTSHAIPAQGTVVVSGGDGTISFVMSQLDLVRDELCAEFRAAMESHTELSFHPQPVRNTGAAGEETTAHSEGEEASAVLDTSAATVNGSSPLEAGAARATSGVEEHQKEKEEAAVLAKAATFFTLPAIAPIPLGTGNDYSNCVGFGNSFSRYKTGGLFCCRESSLRPLLRDAVRAPSVPFDRWTADFVPLASAQLFLCPAKAVAQSHRPTAREEEEAEAGTANDSDSLDQTTPPALAAAATTYGATYTGSGTNMANNVHNVDWDAVCRSDAKTRSYAIMNYMGIGYDGYVTSAFNETRRRHPELCSTRIQNKTVYGYMGVRGDLICRPIRQLLPTVCVPNPWPTVTLPHGKPDMIALQVPSTCKALLTSNVSTYGGGAQLWKTSENLVYYQPVRPERYSVRGGRESVTAGVPSSPASTAVGAVTSQQPRFAPSSPSLPAFSVSGRAGSLVTSTAAEDRRAHSNNDDDAAVDGDGFVQGSFVRVPAEEFRPPILTPVAINDHRFELQSMGGLVHYSAAGLGLIGSQKMVQTGEMFVFVLCSPEDLTLTSGVFSPFTQSCLRTFRQQLQLDPTVLDTLSVQIDGEGMPRIEEPTIVHVHQRPGSRVHVRCRNPGVVRQTSFENRVHVDTTTTLQKKAKA